MPASTRSSSSNYVPPHSSTESTSAILTMGHSYFITNSRGELVSAAGSFTNEGNGMAATSNGGKLSKLLVLLFMISNFVLGISTSRLEDEAVCVGTRKVVEPLQHITSDDQRLYVFENADDALNYVELLFLNGTALEGVQILCNDTKTVLEDIEVTPDNDVAINKRWSCSTAPLGIKFTQRRVASSSLGFAPWQKGDCVYNKENKEVDRKVAWRSSTYANISHGFDYKLAQKFAASSGIEIVKAEHQSGTQSSHIGPNDVVSIWTQATMWTCEQQTQKCVRKYYGKHGCKCSAWSSNIHGELPVKNKPINFGFSSGEAAQC
ncbi:hypothetical protein I9W82_002127 [Candida metapsilosis]|uniref:Uncharacterized protein n=1 Tax=Candida metapsilosis TaxID=273372 RepID=A0A8H8DCF1_9ASCO|nr:hypothetical protein I9W82_002127 [Candida metapsilosis]